MANLEMFLLTVLKMLVDNKLTRFDDLKVVAVVKCNAVIDFPNPEVALDVSALLKVDVSDA